MADVIASLRGSVGYVRLNRPEQRNAINKEMWRAIPKEMHELEKQGARVIVLLGEGDGFSSGANTQEAAQISTHAEASDLWHAIRDSLKEVCEIAPPTIAMIHGSCFGGGCLLACACDLRIASANAVIGIPVARLGLTLDDGTMSRLVSLVGPAHAKRLLFTGDSLDGVEAEKIGLVNFVVSHNRLRSATDELAERIIANVQFSIQSTKKSINRIISQSPFASDLNDDEVVGAFTSDEFQQKVKEKRIKK